jgi:predicted phage terminase large subunit-like protein
LPEVYHPSNPWTVAARHFVPPLPPRRWATPGELAKALDPETVQTPALDLIDAALVDVAEGCCNRLIISMPPQEGKSTRISRYGVEWWLLRNPNSRVVMISYGDDIARVFASQVRGDVVTFDGTDGTIDLGLRVSQESRAAGRWTLAPPHRGSLTAVGLYGAITGRPVDLLVIDDPVKDYRAADSELLSEQAWNTWQSVARPRLAPNAPVIVVLTRWHENDLAGRLLAQQAEDAKAGLPHYDRWIVLNIPAQADHHPEQGQSDVLGRTPGEYLRSARGRTDAQWEATKAATSPRIWSALYQGRPSPDAGDVFNRAWWVRYSEPLWSRDGLAYRIEDGRNLLQSWDMTFKDTTGTDFVVGQVWAYKGAQAWLVDQVRDRMTFTETLKAVRTLTAKWPQATAKLIEDKANGPAVIDSLKKEIGGIIPVNPKESKVSRARAVSPFVEAGNVFLPTKDVALFDVGGFVEETAGFPTAAHDDQVDGMSQALQRMMLGVQMGNLWQRELDASPTVVAGGWADVPGEGCPQSDDGRHFWNDGFCVHCRAAQRPTVAVPSGPEAACSHYRRRNGVCMLCGKEAA